MLMLAPVCLTRREQYRSSIDLSQAGGACNSFVQIQSECSPPSIYFRVPDSAFLGF